MVSLSAPREVAKTRGSPQSVDEGAETTAPVKAEPASSAPVLRIISRTKRTVADDTGANAGLEGREQSCKGAETPGAEGEESVSRSRGSDGKYLPTPTEKLKTPEEKIAEFLNQIAFIERAVDEHDERERLRRRRLRRRCTYTGSEEEFFSDDVSGASGTESEDSAEDEAEREKRRGTDRERENAVDEAQDDLLGEIVAAELEAERKRGRGRRETESDKARCGGNGDGQPVSCTCLCAFCKYCHEKEDARETETKKRTKHDAKQVEALLWTIAAELHKLTSTAEAAWRKRTETTLETRRFDWQAGALDTTYFLAKLRALREDLKAKVEQEERREKLQSNSSELASAFPYSPAVAPMKEEKPSSSVSSSQPSRSSSSPAPGPISAFSCIRSVYDPKRSGFSPVRPSVSSSTPSVSSSAPSSVSSLSSRSVTHISRGSSSYAGDGEVPLPSSPPPPMPPDEDESESEERGEKEEKGEKGEREENGEREEKGEREERGRERAPRERGNHEDPARAGERRAAEALSGRTSENTRESETFLPSRGSQTAENGAPVTRILQKTCVLFTSLCMLKRRAEKAVRSRVCGYRVFSRCLSGERLPLARDAPMTMSALAETNAPRA